MSFMGQGHIKFSPLEALVTINDYFKFEVNMFSNARDIGNVMALRRRTADGRQRAGNDDTSGFLRKQPS